MEGYKIAAEAIIEHDENGKVHIHEPGKGGEGAAVGALGGGIIGFDWILLGLGVFADMASYFGSYAERRRIPYGDRFPTY